MYFIFTFKGLYLKIQLFIKNNLIVLRDLFVIFKKHYSAFRFKKNTFELNVSISY